MEEKEMNKKNKTVFIVIIIILVILLCVGAFFLGRWITNKETNRCFGKCFAFRQYNK